MALMEYCLVNVVLGDSDAPKPPPPEPPKVVSQSFEFRPMIPFHYPSVTLSSLFLYLFISLSFLGFIKFSFQDTPVTVSLGSVYSSFKVLMWGSWCSRRTRYSWTGRHPSPRSPRRKACRSTHAEDGRSTSIAFRGSSSRCSSLFSISPIGSCSPNIYRLLKSCTSKSKVVKSKSIVLWNFTTPKFFS